MIRPVSCLCAMLAAGSGLYLYQVKHRTLMLDARIADVLRQAETARARTAVLKTDYAMLNQTDRLTELAGRYLALHPLTPTQFVQLAGLDRHLPPIEQFPRPGQTPTAAAAGTTDQDDADPVATIAALADVPPLLVAAVTPRQPTHAIAVAPPHHAVAVARYAADDRPQIMPLAVPRPVASSVLSTAYRPASRPRETIVAPLPYAGSALGAASTTQLAPPVPVTD